MKMNLMSLTAVELGKKIKSGEVKVVDAVQDALYKIEAVEKDINSYVTVYEKERVLKNAEEIQEKIDAGELTGPLAGVPVAIKDNMCTKGNLTTCSSKILGNFYPIYSAEAVVNLEKVVRTDTVVKETLVRDTVMKETVVHDTVRIETPVTLQEANQLIGEGKDISGMTISTFGKAVTFDLDKSVIKPQSYQYLDTLAAMLISTNMHCEVRGHTDNSGTNWHNARLSKDRAVAVVQYLKRKGVNPAKLTYSSYGSTRPVATNDTEEGRSQNRRVEFVITK